MPRYFSKEHRRKLSLAQIKYYRTKGRNKSRSKAISKALKKYFKSGHPSIKSRIRNLKKYYKDHPEARKRISQVKKAQFIKNPKLAREIDKRVTEWWKDNPQARKRHSKRIRQFFINNPEAFREFMKHGKNPLKPHLKTSQGFIVRSKGEKQIANFLEKNKIPSLYESIILPITTPPFNGNICTPDFYIPQWNIFIEFYGGYPAAWKKKVLKNKLYKAHKIPVLAITPAELEDMDYFLMKQGEQLSQTEIAKEFDVKKWISG